LRHYLSLHHSLSLSPAPEKTGIIKLQKNARLHKRIPVIATWQSLAHQVSSKTHGFASLPFGKFAQIQFPTAIIIMIKSDLLKTVFLVLSQTPSK
jgi:hypothetical protein